MAKFKMKEYMFNFEGSGWNTVWAKTHRGAIQTAIKEYKDSSDLKPDVNTFELVSANQKRYQILLSLFY